MKLVNNMPVEEVLVNAGTLDFGKDLAAKATIALWRDRATETPLIGEFAFQLKFESYRRPPRQGEGPHGAVLQGAADPRSGMGAARRHQDGGGL